MTLADIMLATATLRAGQTVCGAAEREKVYPRVFAHFAKVAADERIKTWFAEPGFVETPLTVNAE